MTPTPQLTRLLGEMDAMTDALQCAAEALSMNSLSEFENSLWQQETLAPLLTRSVQQVGRASVSAADRAALLTAAARLLQCNRSYHGIVRQGTQTVASLLELSSFHQRELASERRGSSLLSCEV